MRKMEIYLAQQIDI